MKYLGGKFRHAKSMTAAILADAPGRTKYVEPFIGGASMLKSMAPNFTTVQANDLDSDVIQYWSGIKEGWVPPESISEDQYYQLKLDPTPSPLRAHAAFNASFGGKKWGGYARGNDSKGNPRNYASEGSRRDNRDDVRTALQHVQFTNISYDQITLPEDLDNTVIYCDPPYAGTTGYRTGSWDSNKFWVWCTQLANRGAAVYVSEYAIPDNIPHQILWQADHVKSVHGGSKVKTRARSIEYVYKVLPSSNTKRYS